jgi:hypothetical protein
VRVELLRRLHGGVVRPDGLRSVLALVIADSADVAPARCAPQP